MKTKEIKPLENPFKEAARLAKKMREFRARTEKTARSEDNINAEGQIVELVKIINWSEFNNIINQLELMQGYINKLKNA